LFRFSNYKIKLLCLEITYPGGGKYTMGFRIHKLFIGFQIARRALIWEIFYQNPYFLYIKEYSLH